MAVDGLRPFRTGLNVAVGEDTLEVTAEELRSWGSNCMDHCIPKRIIQTGRSRDLPLLHRAAVANIKLLNPDFEYSFFDDDDVVQFFDREFPQYRTLFDSFRLPIQRYDFFRYLAIYRYGGFYLDLDVLLASSMASLTAYGCIFPFEDLNINRFLRQHHRMDWTIGNYAFGATPEHPFLWKVILNCIRGQEHPAWVESTLRGIPRLFRDDFAVLATTGPWLVSRTLAESAEVADSVRILFPDDVRRRETWHNFGNVGIHLMEGSWRTQRKPLRRRLFTLWEAWMMRRCMRESSRLGAKRSSSGFRVGTPYDGG